MDHFAIQSNSFVTESAKQADLINVRNVTKVEELNLSAAERRSVKECDRILADSRTTWHKWSEVRKQMRL